MKHRDTVRYELICGRLTSDADFRELALYRERHEQHERAKLVADKLGVNSFFEESYQHGTWHLDGYVYAPLSKALAVLMALKEEKVEVDIADIPKKSKELARQIQAEDWVSSVEFFDD